MRAAELSDSKAGSSAGEASSLSSAYSKGESSRLTVAFQLVMPPVLRAVLPSVITLDAAAGVVLDDGAAGQLCGPTL